MLVVDASVVAVALADDGYDASYVALAEMLDVPLLTADARLGRATGPRCRIDVVRPGVQETGHQRQGRSGANG
ncbi:MAG: type II toxin-antitoxin system VapC family toxin [Actinomycetales bacterium]